MNELQHRVLDVGCSVFGVQNTLDKKERAKRFLEEAIELVRATGMTKVDIQLLIAWEFSRPVDYDLKKEIGGAGCTLMALATAHDHDLLECISTDIERVAGNAEFHRQKHAQKVAVGASGVA